MRTILAWSTLALVVCAPSQGAAEPPELLAKIRHKMADNLAHLPDYTCRQTIERSRRPANSKRFNFADRLRVEVSYVSGKELFAWPGAEKFEEKPLHDLLPGGATGTGSFALHARAVFTTDAPTFTYKGELQEKGHRLLGWAFQILREKSKYTVSSADAAAVVGYHGAFWADADTLDLVRLEVEVDEVPQPVSIAGGSERVTYQRVRIGASEFLLPGSSDLSMTDRAGNQSRNHTEFEACRQYAGQSVVKFGDADAAASTAPEPAKPLQPPPGLEVEALLGKGVHATKSAIGDPVRATLLRPAKKGDTVVIPKNAVLTGRITRIEQRTGRAGTVYVIGVQFDKFEYGGARGPFRGKLDAVSGSSFPLRRYGALPSGKDDAPGEGFFAVYNAQSPIVEDLRMVWHTVRQ